MECRVWHATISYIITAMVRTVHHEIVVVVVLVAAVRVQELRKAWQTHRSLLHSDWLKHCSDGSLCQPAALALEQLLIVSSHRGPKLTEQRLPAHVWDHAWEQHLEQAFTLLATTLTKQWKTHNMKTDWKPVLHLTADAWEWHNSSLIYFVFFCFVFQNQATICSSSSLWLTGNTFDRERGGSDRWGPNLGLLKLEFNNFCDPVSANEQRNTGTDLQTRCPHPWTSLR